MSTRNTTNLFNDVMVKGTLFISPTGSNDHNQINDAYTRLSNFGGGTIILGSGNYSIASPIIPAAGVSITGNSRAKTILNAGANSIQIIDCYDSNLIGVSFSNFTISANGHTGVVGIRIASAGNTGNTRSCTIHNIEFDGLAYGIVGNDALPIGLFDSVISNCEFDGNQTALVITGTGMNVHNCWFRSNSVCAVNLKMLTSSLYNEGTSIGACVFAANAIDIQVSDNKAYNLSVFDTWFETTTQYHLYTVATVINYVYERCQFQPSATLVGTNILPIQGSSTGTLRITGCRLDTSLKSNAQFPSPVDWMPASNLLVSVCDCHYISGAATITSDSASGGLLTRTGTSYNMGGGATDFTELRIKDGFIITDPSFGALARGYIFSNGVVRIGENTALVGINRYPSYALDVNGTAHASALAADGNFSYGGTFTAPVPTAATGLSMQASDGNPCTLDGASYIKMQTFGKWMLINAYIKWTSVTRGANQAFLVGISCDQFPAANGWASYQPLSTSCISGIANVSAFTGVLCTTLCDPYRSNKAVLSLVPIVDTATSPNVNGYTMSSSYNVATMYQIANSGEFYANGVVCLT